MRDLPLLGLPDASVVTPGFRVYTVHISFPVSPARRRRREASGGAGRGHQAGGRGQGRGAPGARVRVRAPSSRRAEPRFPQRSAPGAHRRPRRGCCVRVGAGEGPGRAAPHAHPPARPFSRGWWQVSGCRGTARQRRKQDAAEIRLLTCSCDYPALIKAELPVVSLLPPSASPSPDPAPSCSRGPN